jgi:hypothetical protein
MLGSERTIQNKNKFAPLAFSHPALLPRKKSKVERVQQKIVYAGGDSNTEKQIKQVPPFRGDNDNYLRKRRGQANIHPLQKVVCFVTC